MRFQFNEKKAAQAAAHLLERAGGSLPYLHLLKLLYVADRRNLVEQGLLITGDRLVAMKHGMVLSAVLDLMRGQARGTWWPRYIRPEGEYDVSLIGGVETDELSPFEKSLLDDAFLRFGSMEMWKVVDHLHDTLAEWKSAWHSPERNANAVPVSPEDVMRAAHVSEEEIADRQAIADDVMFFSGR